MWVLRDCLHRNEKLSNHTNTEGFHLRLSTIPGYSKSTFNAKNYFADKRDQRDLLEATVAAWSAASAARQAQVAAAVASTSCLRGETAFVHVSPPSLSSLVASVVDPLFQTLVSSSPPVLSTPNAGLASNATVVPWVVSPTRCTTSTITVPTCTQLRSVFPLQTSVPTPVTQLAPLVPSKTLQPDAAVDNSSTLRATFQDCQSQPTSSATASEPQYSHSPTSMPPASESTSVQPTYVQPQPTYNSFGSLFPFRLFSSPADMPTSLLIHSLVQTVLWTSTMLRGVLTGTTLPTNLVPVDEVGRAVLMATPFWPGRGHSMSSPLEELLGDMMPIYTQLLAHGPYTY